MLDVQSWNFTCDSVILCYGLSVCQSSCVDNSLPRAAASRGWVCKKGLGPERGAQGQISAVYGEGGDGGVGDVGAVPHREVAPLHPQAREHVQ